MLTCGFKCDLSASGSIGANILLNVHLDDCDGSNCKCRGGDAVLVGQNTSGQFSGSILSYKCTGGASSSLLAVSFQTSGGPMELVINI